MTGRARSTGTAATVVHPRSLEIFESLGLVERFVDVGTPQRGAKIHSDGEVLGAYDLTDCGSSYDFDIGVSEEVTESILADYLREQGGEVTRSSRLVGLTRHADGVRAEIDRDGDRSEIDARWVVGCDGLHSPTREASGIGFEGHDIAEPWAVFDTTLQDWPEVYDVTLVYLDAIPVILTALPDRRWRVYLRPSSAESDLVADAAGTLHRYYPAVSLIDVENPTRFHCHTRVAAQFRAGPVLLAGDAAHLCSPAQGHGMNTGLQDAVNLAWKLALVHNGVADPALLDSYEVERRPVAVLVGEAGDDFEGAQTLTDPGERDRRNQAMRGTFAEHGVAPPRSGRPRRAESGLLRIADRRRRRQPRPRARATPPRHDPGPSAGRRERPTPRAHPSRRAHPRAPRRTADRRRRAPRTLRRPAGRVPVHPCSRRPSPSAPAPAFPTGSGTSNRRLPTSSASRAPPSSPCAPTGTSVYGPTTITSPRSSVTGRSSSGTREAQTPRARDAALRNLIRRERRALRARPCGRGIPRGRVPRPDALELPEVVGACQPHDMTPQLDRLVVGRHAADDRTEDARSLAAVQTDGRHPERAELVDDVPVLGDHRVPRRGVVDRGVVQRRVEAGVGERAAHGVGGPEIFRTVPGAMIECVVEAAHGVAALGGTDRDGST